jgi:hypothetical protein
VPHTDVTEGVLEPSWLAGVAGVPTRVTATAPAYAAIGVSEMVSVVWL